jgi:hypothetical protein
MKTMKVGKFVEWVKTKKDKVLSLSAVYYDEGLIWQPRYGAIVWEKGDALGDLRLDWTLEDALRRIKGGRVNVVFSDLGEIALRLRR